MLVLYAASGHWNLYMALNCTHRSFDKSRSRHTVSLSLSRPVHNPYVTLWRLQSITSTEEKKSSKAMRLGCFDVLIAGKTKWKKPHWFLLSHDSHVKVANSNRATVPIMIRVKTTFDFYSVCNWSDAIDQPIVYGNYLQSVAVFLIATK